MGIYFLVILAVGYLIFRITYEVPRQLKRTEEKIDLLKLQMQEIQMKLSEINDQLEKK